MSRAARLALLGLLAAACGPRGSGPYVGVGTVTDVQPAVGQIMLAHEEIAGLMPAMTMSFDVAPGALRPEIAAGDRVRFQLEVERGHYRIVSLDKIGGGDPAAPNSGFGGVAAEQDAAPGFALVDQDGRPVSLESLRGSLVLLDFIYTTCQGPCPITTAARAAVQKALPEALRPRVRFVSISLDPAHDTPEVLRRYAAERGADLDGWSFLTGEPAQVDGVLARYGVGKLRDAHGQLEHVVVTFLIDPDGQIAKRYFGLEHGTDEYLRDLAAGAG